VVLRGQDVKDVPLSSDVMQPRQVDPNGQIVKTARQMGICLGD